MVVILFQEMALLMVLLENKTWELQNVLIDLKI